MSRFVESPGNCDAPIGSLSPTFCAYFFIEENRINDFNCISLVRITKGCTEALLLHVEHSPWRLFHVIRIGSRSPMSIFGLIFHRQYQLWSERCWKYIHLWNEDIAYDETLKLCMLDTYANPPPMPTAQS